MEIKSIGVLGSINGSINIQLLSSISSKCRCTYSQCFLKIEDNITARIYNSGKIQIYGIKNEDDIQYYWDLIINFLKKYIDVSNAWKKPEIKIIIASEKLPYKVNLQLLFHTLTLENIEYEPEQFPNLIWRLTYCTCLLFSTGSCVFVGANSMDKLNDSLKEIKTKIESVSGALL